MLSVDNALVYKHAFISVYTSVSKKELRQVDTHYTSPVVWPLVKVFFRYTYMTGKKKKIYIYINLEYSLSLR